MFRELKQSGLVILAAARAGNKSNAVIHKNAGNLLKDGTDENVNKDDGQTILIKTYCL